MILPPSTLGMLGGGQLGRFFTAAAHEMGYRVWVLDPDPHSPAGRIADRHLIAGYDDYRALDELAEGCAAVSTEFENVPAGTLDYLAKFIVVHPSPAAVSICQNRIAEKTFLHRHRLPHGEFMTVRCEQDLREADHRLFPGILKVARLGYDGKGQTVVHGRDEAMVAYQQLKGEPCVLERKLELELEMSVVLARDESGALACYPALENSHRKGILDVSTIPARTSPALRERAAELAGMIARQLAYVGTLAVEFFVVEGNLLVNEIAPRPHNSGHLSLDACVSSQFEQQVRALCGLPLGETRAHSAATMVNLLGDLWYDSGAGTAPHYREPDWSPLLAVAGLKLHLYGKHHARPGRKMGHFTVLDDDAQRARAAAMAARAAIGIGDED